jgi:hypothetical protein
MLKKSKSLMLCYLLRLRGAEVNTSTVSELSQRLISDAIPLAQKPLLLTLASEALESLFLSKLIRLFTLY